MHLSYGLESSLFGVWGGGLGRLGSVNLFDPSVGSDRSAVLSVGGLNQEKPHAYSTLTRLLHVYSTLTPQGGS